MKNFKIKIFLIVGVLIFVPNFVFAQIVAPRTALKEIFLKRPDLQKVFNSTTWIAKKGTRASSLGNLENWARLYGSKEYPIELAAYRPEQTLIGSGETFPKLKSGAKFNEAAITAESFIVIDKKTNKTLLSKKPNIPWPIASLTKLTTAMVALQDPSPHTTKIALTLVDDVGGGKLRVTPGTEFSFNDLMASMIIGSANNAATAIARVLGNGQENFVNDMNELVARLGTTNTELVDPSGIEIGNMSTVGDYSKVASAAFDISLIKDLAGRTRWDATTSTSELKRITTTNWLLTDSRYNDIFVLAGKTGYIDESKWNLATLLKPMRGDQHELLIVNFGSAGRRESFDDAANLARWTWKNFEWE